MAIPFTDREIYNAWQANWSVSCKLPRTNVHRLLLFYAVECGLKAILLRKKGCKRTDLCKEIIDSQHNINKLLDCLGAGDKLKLPEMFIKEILDIKNKKEERKLNSGHINQAWRYGGKIILISDRQGTQKVTDQDIEQKLIAIVKWIEQEVERL